MAAAQGLAASSSISGTEGSDPPAESTQRRGDEVLPPSVQAPCGRRDAWAPALPAQDRGMHGEGRRRTGAAAAQALTPPPWSGEEPPAQGQSAMEGTPGAGPAKLIRAHFPGPSANRFLLCFPIAPWDFFPRGCPLLPLSLLSWSSGISHFPPLRKRRKARAQVATGGAGSGQPGLWPALTVSRDTKPGCGESCSFVPCLLAFFLAF